MKRSVLIILTAIVLLAGCAQPSTASLLQSNQSRVSSSVFNPADRANLINGNSTFAIDLYLSLKDTDGNLFCSPYSISQALAMTYGGARGTTEKQIADTLHFKLPQTQLHPAFNSLDQELASRRQGTGGQDGKGFRLHIVNSIWGQQGFQFSPEFLDLLAKNYGAGLRILDFIQAAEQSRTTINQWVSDQTEGKIKDLIPRGIINQLTRLVLTNAIYFNAAWKYPFQVESSSNGSFHLLDGSDVSVTLMKQTKPYGYASGENYQAVELLYEGNELSMVILLPKLDRYKTFESALSNQQLNNILQDIKYREVMLSMPRFKFDSSFNLNKALSTMGMPLAFTADADFSGMDGKKDLYISGVVHKSFISVNESGTEAAASTAVVMSTTAMPAQPVEVTLDHPFIFLIRDIKTATILSMGRVLNPNP